MKKWLYFVIWFVVLVTVGLHLVQRAGFSVDKQTIVQKTTDVSLNDFVARYESGDFMQIIEEDAQSLKWYRLIETKTVDNVLWLGKSFVQEYVEVYQTPKPQWVSLLDLGISLTWDTQVEALYTTPSVLRQIFEFAAPLLGVLLVFFLIFRFMGPKGGGMPFNLKIGKLASKTGVQTKFKDVAGMHEVKEELAEIVDYLKNPAKYHKVGARHPKWVLLYGQPWSGKTLLARAVAGESNTAFFSSSGSEFMEMLVGMWAAKVRELFTKAKSAGKAIIFIDEIDAIGKKRWSGYTGGHQEQEQTLNQILTEMDGFDKNATIVVIAATNRPDTLDPALMRAGRFDRKIYVSRPTLEERIEIFSYYLEKKKMAKDLKIPTLAKRTSGLVWADIENIVNEASMKIAKDNRSELTAQDFEYALEKVLMWPEKKIKSITDEEKKIVAYHELGHAITAHILPHADPVEKISIVSRWQALGVTWMMPKEEKYLHSKQKFLDDVVSLLGGRAAEEVFFGKEAITTGASNDFERATKTITDLVATYGMDEELGPVRYMDAERDDGWYGFTKPFSEKTAEKIDAKIKEYLVDAYAKAKDIITKNRKLIDSMAQLLLLKEYITKDEFDAIMEDPRKAKEFYTDAQV
jgi:cell division protease FtsH